MSKEKTSGKQIESFQALRFLAFLGIFFAHTEFFISWSPLAVSIFFCLSGFLLQYRHGAANQSLAFKTNLKFAVRHIRKLYPLHLITMAFGILLTVIDMVKGQWMSAKSLVFLGGKIVLNMTLLKSLVPVTKIAISLNGVSWFLSTMLVLYFLFPWISGALHRLENKYLIAVCVSIPFLQTVICIPVLSLFGIESDFYTWFMYIFPLFRLGDLAAGCCIGTLYRRKQEQIRGGIAFWSVFELFTVIITFAICICAHTDSSNLFLSAFLNETSPYIIPAVLWIFLFAINKGIVTRCCSNPLLLWLGSLSAEAFLIHGILSQFFHTFLQYSGVESLTAPMRVLLVAIQFLITIGLSLLAKKRFAHS